MIPAAPASRARPIRRRSPDCGRTMAVVRSPIAWSWPISSDSVPAPCSRSTISQSKPARARSSAWIAEPPLTNDPNSVSPARILARSEPAGGGRSGTYHLDCSVGRNDAASKRDAGARDAPGSLALAQDPIGLPVDLLLLGRGDRALLLLLRGARLRV